MTNPTSQIHLNRQSYRSYYQKIKTKIAWTLHDVSIRWFESGMAVLLTITLAPLLLTRGLISMLMTGQVFSKRTVIGKDGISFNLYYFAGELKGSRLAHLINIIKGDLAFVGPGIKTTINAERLSVRPGIISLYSLRKQVRIAHDDEINADREYIYRQSFSGNTGIIIRNLIGQILGGSNQRISPSHIDFFGISVTNTNMDDAVKWILMMTQSKDKSQLAFVNPDCLNIAWNNSPYKSVLENVTRVLPDGIGVHIGCRIQNVALEANVNGTDLFPKLCESMVNTNKSLYLLGAKPGVAEATAKNMMKRFPGLKICGSHHGYFDVDETDKVIEQINQANPSILLVAMGAPTQELWISDNREKLNAKVAMGVGGLFDFYSGQIVRAPLWLREIGMEWCWRIIQEPKRMWKRYVIGNPIFIYRIWRYGERYSNKSKDNNKNTNLKASNNNFVALSSARRIIWSFTEVQARIIKRTLDIVLSTILLICISPLLLLVAAAIRVESSGPILFKQVRIGRGGKEFIFWKFRSMYSDAEKRKMDLIQNNEMKGGVLFKMRDDPRITWVGKFIRRTSIDELPQLWNVIHGDMSLVGPRPCLPSEADKYSSYDRNRFDANPGITCTWQVSGRSDIPFEQQIKMDVEYVNQATCKTDFSLMLKTIPAVFSGRGAY